MQVLLHVVSFAFLLVMASTAMLAPVLLVGFNLRAEGWRWPHAALFAAMLASTDAVAVSALLKSGVCCRNALLIYPARPASPQIIHQSCSHLAGS